MERKEDGGGRRYSENREDEEMKKGLKTERKRSLKQGEGAWEEGGEGTWEEGGGGGVWEEGGGGRKGPGTKRRRSLEAQSPAVLGMRKSR